MLKHILRGSLTFAGDLSPKRHADMSPEEVRRTGAKFAGTLGAIALGAGAMTGLAVHDIQKIHDYSQQHHTSDREYGQLPPVESHHDGEAQLGTPPTVPAEQSQNVPNDQQ